MVLTCLTSIVEQHSILQGVPPVLIGEAGIDKHGSYLFNKHLVHPFCNSIVLRHVSSSELLLDPLVLEEGLDFPSDVLAPSIGTQDFESLTGLEFDSSDEGMQMLDHLGLLLHGVDKNFA